MRSRTGLDENCFDFARNFEWKRFVVFESFYIVCKKQRDFVTLQKKKKNSDFVLFLVLSLCLFG